MTWGLSCKGCCHSQGLPKFFENATHIIFSISSLILTFFIASARLFEAQSNVRCHAQNFVYALVSSLPIKMSPRSVPPWKDIGHLSLTVSLFIQCKNHPKQPQAVTGLPEINDPNGPNPIQTSCRDSWSRKNPSEVDEPMNSRVWSLC